jgi:hypothetical protein
LLARYVNTYPRPVTEAIEARFKLTRLYQQTGPADQLLLWQNQLLSAATADAVVHSERVRYLAATTALAIADRQIESFKRIALVAPIKNAFLKKKDAMARAVDSLIKARDYALQQTTTEATFKIADLYAEFAKALLASERPKELSGDELEQYNLLLEEQAIPFEDKAIEYNTQNTQFVKQGIYDQWVKKSFTVLAKLIPAQYARMEKTETYVDIPLLITQSPSQQTLAR